MTGFTKKRHDRPIQGALTVIFKQIEKLRGYAPALSVTYVFLRPESPSGRISSDSNDFNTWLVSQPHMILILCLPESFGSPPPRFRRERS